MWFIKEVAQWGREGRERALADHTKGCMTDDKEVCLRDRQGQAGLGWRESPQTDRGQLEQSPGHYAKECAVCF